MALTVKTEQSQVLLTRERTYELHVHNKLGEVPRIVAQREQVEMRGDEVARWLTCTLFVKRDFPKVSNETIDLVGRENDPITVGQLWATIANLLDRWAVEDRPELAEEVRAAATDNTAEATP